MRRPGEPWREIARLIDEGLLEEVDVAVKRGRCGKDKTKGYRRPKGEE